jgi:uncharacterized protein YebE (UPF0316 family)
MKMQMFQFESIVNLVQMKLMKMIHNDKNKTIQNSQYSVEFELKQVTILQMQVVQLESIENLIDYSVYFSFGFA